MKVELAPAWDVALPLQREVCRASGAVFSACDPDLRIGLAPNVTEASRQLNGVRIAPEGDACGWYIWAGEDGFEPDDFYIPLRAQSLETWVPAVIPYLGLPPGWRFQLRDGRVTVWQDAAVLTAA